MKALSDAMGAEVELSPSGSAAFETGGRGVLLQWQERLRAFTLHIDVGPLAGWRDGEVCKELLAANFMLLQTGGGALSYNASANVVGLEYVIPVSGLDPKDFPRMLDAAILAADDWRQQLVRMCAEQERVADRLQRGEAEAAAPAAPGGEFPADTGFMRV